MGKRTRLSHWTAALVAVPLFIAVTAAPAAACAGLVGENGTIRLTRTSTLAAWHNGVERYVTSFAFSGQGKEVGSIVPLPGVPTDVKRAGDWTLQRLEREVAPPVRALAEDSSFKASAGVERRHGFAAEEDRRARHHDLERWRHGSGEVGHRSRLLAHARRARDARLLLAPQPGVHGRAFRRGARAGVGANER